MGFLTCIYAFCCLQTCDKEESHALDDVETEYVEFTDNEEKVSYSYGKEEDEKMDKTYDISVVEKLEGSC